MKLCQAATCLVSPFLTLPPTPSQQGFLTNIHSPNYLGIGNQVGPRLCSALKEKSELISANMGEGTK
jgi:hypothetical protein